MSAMFKPATTAIQSLGAIELVTPDYAAELLKLNVANRPLNKDTVDALVAAMNRGEWMYNGDAIRISNQNVLLDGQHRLEAIKKSGIPQWCRIERNLPPEAFDTIDRGRKRTVSDSLSVRGEKYAPVLASAIRWILVIERGGAYSNRVVSAPESVAVLETYPDVRHWVMFYASHKGLRKFFDSALCAVATLFARKYGAEVVEQFLTKLASGENLKRTDPAYELRARVIQSKTSTSKTPTYIMVPLMMKAMKAHVAGKQIGVLRHRADEEFPTV